MAGNLNRYLDLLGMKPGATLQEITTNYYLLLSKFPKEVPRTEEKRLQELQHAFNVLRRAYMENPPHARNRSLLPRGKLSRVGILALAAGAILLALGLLTCS